MAKLDYNELRGYVASVQCELFELKDRVTDMVHSKNVTGKALDHYHEQALELDGLMIDNAFMLENIDKLAKKNSDFEKTYGI